ncbi:MAG: response regulator [Desulfobulbaceae bacterium]|nr:response regulator [Desulfobulbaceae bacterium]MCK5339696.1 response regulator [Desulfobulbaceae bacterium]MCK5404827.1 response regulator [Desulfobulbaceae bacterium]
MQNEKKHILIVDDIPMNIKVLSQSLRDDYTVTFATGGKEALDRIKASPPDLILLDVMMPDMDGFEVCKRLKADETTQHIPIIFLTAKQDVEDAIKGLTLGGDDYVIKPFDAEKVKSLIKKRLSP